MKDNPKENEKILQAKVSKSVVIKSLIWKFLERIGVQGVQFVIQIFLARLLCPEDYGIIAILVAFISIASIFVSSGFGTALIQKKDADEIDFSSVFYLSLFISVIAYIIMFLAAPFIAKFYKMELLSPVLRVYSVVLIFGGLTSVHNAIVSKTMKFKNFFYTSIIAIVLSGIAGVVLAFKGFGPWALVCQQVVHSIVTCAVLWITVKWKPKLIFSFKRTKQLFSFGWKLLVSSLLDTVYKQMYNLTVGKFYTSSDLGNFSRGEQFPQLIETNVDGSIQSVMMPALAAHNDNAEEVKKIMRRSITMSAYIMFPCMLGLAAVAPSLVSVLLTDKWLGCVPFIMLSCFSFALYPIHTSNLTAINAMGRSDLFLKLEIIKKIIGFSALMISIKFGLITMACVRVVTGIISTFINAHPNKKILNYSYFEQLKDLLPSFMISIIMFIAVYMMNKISVSPIILLIIQIFSGTVIYVVLSILFKVETFKYILDNIKNSINKKKNINN